MLYIPHVEPERVAVGPDSGKRVTVEHAHNDMKMMDRLLRSKRLLRFLPSHLFGMYWYALRASEAFVLLVLKSLAHTKMSLVFFFLGPRFVCIVDTIHAALSVWTIASLTSVGAV